MGLTAEVFTVKERGVTDLRDLARALRERGYQEASPDRRRIRPGEFVIRNRELICCQTLADRRNEEDA